MSEEDEYYYEDDGEENESLRDSDEDLGFNTAAEFEDTSRQAQYLVYTEEQLRERKMRALSEVTSVLSIPDADAVRVLRLFKWDVNRVKEEWFTDMPSLKEKIGLIEALPPPESASKPRGRSKRARCNVCFEDFPEADMRSTGCRHLFCQQCWHGYLSAAIEAGPSVLDLRCPLPDCTAAVPTEVLEEVCSAEEVAKVRQFALRSYVEDSRKLTWCPAPGCEHAVECTADIGAEPLDVTCNCGSTFCFTCKEEAHRPVDCETVATWIRKNSAESENLNWILANTKPCPKCKRPIEKNQGCMHMSCSQCKYEFCWLCLAPWKEHGEATGGFYACNRYEAGKKEGKFTEEEAKREHAKHSLERYMHYYQRWNENDKSRVKAQQKMAELQGSKLEGLSEITATPTSQLKFITDAWAQVVECRRILKWTYAYGYYSFQPAEERRKGAPPAATKEQQGFFEFNQGQAESYLERLHKMVENDLNEFIEGTTKVDAWAKWRENLIGLTDVTRSHFSKLVMELEKGLDAMLADYQNDEAAIGMDVEDDDASAGPEAGPSGVARGAAAKKPRTRTRTVGKRNRAAKGSGSNSAADSNNGVDLPDVDGAWQCRHCTFANTNVDAETCEVCEQSRYS